MKAAGNAVDFSYDEAMKNCYQCADAGKVRKLAEEVSGEDRTCLEYISTHHMKSV